MPNETIEEKKLALELERLQIEKGRFANEQRFFQKNMGTVIAALISLSALLVSAVQVWIANNTQYSENSKLDQDRDRRWQLDLTKFVLEQMDRIFSGDLKERERVR